MKVAYFSPFPPKETGIALYSDQLLCDAGSGLGMPTYSNFDV